MQVACQSSFKALVSRSHNPPAFNLLQTQLLRPGERRQCLLTDTMRNQSQNFFLHLISNIHCSETLCASPSDSHLRVHIGIFLGVLFNSTCLPPLCVPCLPPSLHQEASSVSLRYTYHGSCISSSVDSGVPVNDELLIGANLYVSQRRKTRARKVRCLVQVHQPTVTRRYLLPGPLPYILKYATCFAKDSDNFYACQIHLNRLSELVVWTGHEVDIEGI